MQILKQTYIKYLQDVSAILSPLKFDVKKQEELIDSLRATELIVPVVGGFSAGKSTLINSFLGSGVLPTNITPETALATELRYGEESYFEAVKENGDSDRYDLAQTDEIKERAAEYKFLRLYLNNENLKAIEPLVLVDMPGFDSPIQLHNQAILSYLSKGKYFIVLISVEDGNITSSVLRELQNINEFGKGFSFCVSKANLRAPSDVDLIKNRIEEQLKDYLDYQKDVTVIGLDSGGELKNILEKIDSKELFKNMFESELKQSSFEAQSAIDTTKSALKSSKEEAQNAINELKRGIENLKAKKQAALNEIQSRYSDGSVNSVIAAVANDINMNIDTLASLAAVNQQGFAAELNGIIKTSLVREIKNKMSDIGSQLVDNFSLEMRSLNLTDFKIDDVWIEKISQTTKEFLQKAQSGLIDFSKKLKSGENAGRLYKAITTIIGLTTTVINPLLEVVIVFLPEIILFFTQGYAENKKREQAREQIINSVIPSVKTKLRSEMPSLLNEQISAMIEAVSDKFEEQLRQKEAEISKAVKEKGDDVQDIEAQILALENAKEEIKTLTTKILYAKD
ncbi:hypothetical protein CAMRE0001_1506 [Campylobacter rectus RM3267]|uniref:GTP-binding protein (Dynamin domain) n=2 Tax=Campylobacter rectus TaxID=203 RepID=A0A6G5QP74_CAMRE|nr:dynamin family protein [Campylobacter rectus]EEF14994.1 hypothetical protein CAMRE0001_1506 [Campylobacter rectus RM3267]QCD47528.1 GTP-binding protein (dynamin domain) [Campylobacter rectus]RRD53136.1 hypothetical protein EII16_09560 [Campylobacter rectus]UEB48221.1 dynamin family protein [Campylobacter rectus]